MWLFDLPSKQKLYELGRAYCRSKFRHRVINGGGCEGSVSAIEKAVSPDPSV